MLNAHSLNVYLSPGPEGQCEVDCNKEIIDATLKKL